MAVNKFTLVVSPSPIGLAELDETNVLEIEQNTSISSMLKTANLIAGEDVYAFKNGRLCRGHELIDDDCVVFLKPAAKEAVTAATIASFIVEALISAAISYAVGYLIREISGGGNEGNQERQAIKDSEGYSLWGGGNQYRYMQPFPLIFGKHRIFPDYSSPWFVDYVADAEPQGVVPGLAPLQKLINHQRFLFNAQSGALAPWTLLVPNGDTLQAAANGTGLCYGNLLTQGVGGVFYGDNIPSSVQDMQANTINFDHTIIVYRQDSGQVFYYSAIELLLSDGQSNGQPLFVQKPYVDTPIGTTTDYDYIYAYGVLEYRFSQRLTSIFSYGYGDMIIDDHYIAQTAIANYRDYKVNQADLSNPAESKILGWGLTPTFRNQIGIYPYSVESVEGAKLQQYDGVALSGHVFRQSTTKNCIRIHWDLSGRLASIIDGVQGTSYVEISLRYRIIGSTTWLIPAGYNAQFFISNGALFTSYKQTFYTDVPAGLYEIECWKVTPDSKKPDVIQDINLERVKFFAAEEYKYPAQNRIGTQIIASSQLNGALDRFSSLASNKTWSYVGGSSWDGTYPGAGANWVHQETSNPADWALNVMAGLYLNSVTSVGSTAGIHIGEHPSNYQLLYGYGLAWDEIDFYWIVNFRQYCVSNGLEINAVLETGKTNLEVLIDVCRCGRASPSWQDGKRSVVYFDKNQPLTSRYGMGSIIPNSFSVDYKSDGGTEGIIVDFLDKNDFYSTKQVRSKVPGVVSPLQWQTVKLWGIDNEQMAQREANLIAAEQVYHIRNVQFDTDLEATTLRRGDVISIAHDLTSWAYSGRIKSFAIDGLTIPSFDIDQCFDLPISEIYLLDPLGQSISLNGFVLSGKVTVSSAIFESRFASENIDSIGGQNAASVYSGSHPEDYQYFIGAGGGKKLRVLSVKPKDNYAATITCTDEEEAYYANEFFLQSSESYLEPARIVKNSTQNLWVETRGNFEKWLVWESFGSPSFRVSASINGGSITSLTSTFVLPYSELRLPNYIQGQTVTFNVASANGSLLDNSINETLTYTF